jgi:hypothetical protein
MEASRWQSSEPPRHRLAFAVWVVAWVGLAIVMTLDVALAHL